MSALYWTEERIITAIQDWAGSHGGPPKMNDWYAATVDHPAAQTVRERFGSWSAGVRAAGFRPSRPGMPARWTKESVAAAILDMRFSLGRWPTLKDWEAATGTGRPNTSAVYRLFGTWNAARRYAGWLPRCVICKDELPRRRPDHLYCSRACKGVAERARFAAACRVAALEPSLSKIGSRSGGTPVGHTTIREADAPADERRAA